MSKLTQADILTAVAIAVFFPLYYKLRFALQGLIGWGDLLQASLLVEYLFSALLGFGLVTFHRRFTEAARLGFLLVIIVGALAATAFTAFFYTVVFPYGVRNEFLVDVAILTLFTPLLISGVGDRILLKGRVEQAEQATLREQYASLQSRMSPHFLFNSLNTLAELIEEDPRLAVEFVEKMAHIYRYLIEYQYATRVALLKEIEAAQAFFFVIEARIPGALKVSVSLPQEFARFETVPLAVQSLIENIVKHNRLTASAPIRVSLRIEAGELIVENTVLPRAPRQSHQTGLADLSQRILQLTGKGISYGRHGELFRVSVPLADCPP